MQSQFTLIRLKVVPNSRHESLEFESDDGSQLSMKIKVRAKAEDGKANQALVKYMAGFFDIPVRQVIIQSGQTSRNKLLRVYLSKDQILKRLSAQLPLC